jgi:hypothetical protein
MAVPRNGQKCCPFLPHAGWSRWGCPVPPSSPSDTSARRSTAARFSSDSCAPGRRPSCSLLTGVVLPRRISPVPPSAGRNPCPAPDLLPTTAGERLHPTTWTFFGLCEPQPVRGTAVISGDGWAFFRPFIALKPLQGLGLYRATVFLSPWTTKMATGGRPGTGACCISDPSLVRKERAWQRGRATMGVYCPKGFTVRFGQSAGNGGRAWNRYAYCAYPYSCRATGSGGSAGLPLCCLLKRRQVATGSGDDGVVQRFSPRSAEQIRRSGNGAGRVGSRGSSPPLPATPAGRGEVVHLLPSEFRGNRRGRPAQPPASCRWLPRGQQRGRAGRLGCGQTGVKLPSNWRVAGPLAESASGHISAFAGRAASHDYLSNPPGAHLLAQQVDGGTVTPAGHGRGRAHLLTWQVRPRLPVG